MAKVFLMISLLSMGMTAQANQCANKVEKAVKSIIATTENRFNSQLKADATFLKYVGLHVKRYDVITNHVNEFNETVFKYSVDVFEFDSENTNCEVLNIQKVI